MDINVKGWFGGIDIVFEDTNIKVEETLTETIYAKKEDGKTDFKKVIVRDIDDQSIEKYMSLMDELAYYRKRDFDSSDLIKTLFEKLPDELIPILLSELKEDYIKED